MTSATFYNLCTVGYGLGAAGFVVHVLWSWDAARRAATVTAAIAFLLHTWGMALRWFEAGVVEVAALERALGMPLQGWTRWAVLAQHPPWSNLYEILVFMSWGLVLAALWAQVRLRIRFVGLFALSLALLALGVASLNDSMIKPLVPALKSRWIMIHVISASVAYACGALTALISLLTLVQSGQPVRLAAVARGTMLLSAATALVTGGRVLFATGTYPVRPFAQLPNGELVAVVRIVGTELEPFFVPSPHVGLALMIALVFWTVTAWALYRSRRAVPGESSLVFYWIGVGATLFVLGLMLANGLGRTPVTVDNAGGAVLMPPPPWRLSLKSHVWDGALFTIVLLGQLFVGLACTFPAAVRARLPTVATLDAAAYRGATVTFLLMSVVLITGSLWAHAAWGRYWAWDPKELGALLIWLTYALYLHLRMTTARATAAPVVAVLSFFVILAGFLGVNLGWFAPGLHSYGSE